MKRLFWAALIALSMSGAAAAETVKFACDVTKSIKLSTKTDVYKDKFIYTVDQDKKQVTDGYGLGYILEEFTDAKLQFATKPDKSNWKTIFHIDRASKDFSVKAYDENGEEVTGRIVYGGKCQVAK